MNAVGNGYYNSALGRAVRTDAIPCFADASGSLIDRTLCAVNLILEGSHTQGSSVN